MTSVRRMILSINGHIVSSLDYASAVARMSRKTYSGSRTIKAQVGEPKCIWCSDSKMESVDTAKDGDVEYECPKCGWKAWKSEF
jgi:hypothetical protein